MPLVRLGRRRGFRLRRRVYGPELMLAFCAATAKKGYRYFFYGGAAGVAQELADRLARRHPGLVVAGVHAPLFRALTPAEVVDVISLINSARPDVLWVGLSTPKQERWMYDYHRVLRVPVMVGVGAAFDLLTGRVKQAPAWMREHGLQWF
jgi:N-acetylglucosaminyldiphosphoundecaprenol N-acetyl-beta-D-mannosaminyltransferase